MPFSVTQIADRQLLRWLAGRFGAVGQRKPGLSHATRLVLDPHEGPAANLEGGWDEHVGRRELFGFVTYQRPRGGFQQACFHGERSLLDQFVPLALIAADAMPGDLLRLSAGPGEADVQSRANYWALAVYKIAYHAGGTIPLELSGSVGAEVVDGNDLPWPGSLVADFDADIDRVRPELARWQADAGRRRRKQVRYVYAALKQDVFTASAVAIQRILSDPVSYYQPFASFAVGEAPDDRSLREVPVHRRIGTEGDVANRPNSPRDAWMNELAETGSTYKEVLAQLKTIARVRNWQLLTTDRSVAAAIQKYRERLGLPPINRRRRRG